MTQQDLPEKNDSADTKLEELNDEGVGGTTGPKDTFEPEETETEGKGERA